MDTEGKFIEDPNELFALIPIVSKFPGLHNTIKADFILLLELTEQCKTDTPRFQMLCRTCIKSFFALIEADIFYYNFFDKYPDYNDNHRFIDKFKNTFKQICKTWNRETLQKEYFSAKLSDLIKLKDLRDKLTHPKEIDHIIKPTEDTFFMLKKAFVNYDNFFSILMSNFFFTTKLPLF